MWIFIISKVINGVSTLTQNNIAPGTYDATIYGKSEALSVQLLVT
jgi:hypothetical protein